MGRAGRLFDARDTLARIVLVDLSGVGYLVFGHHAGLSPSRTQWLLAVVAFLAALVLHRRPVAGLLVQVSLLVLAFWLVDDPMINQVGTSWLLFELTMSAARPRLLWGGAGLVAAVYLAFTLGDEPSPVLAPIYGLFVVIGLPVLLGLVIRTTRELGVQARRRAESESRAARADERSAIARELHDVVAHHVASMVLRVGVARHVLPDVDPRVAEVFDDVHGTGTAALADLRRLVAVLRDPNRGTDAALTAIEPGALPTALEAAVETARRAGLTVDATIAPETGSLDVVRGLAVLRLTQEALTNVAKHAGPAARASLRVEVRGVGAGGVGAGGAAGRGSAVRGVGVRGAAVGGGEVRGQEAEGGAAGAGAAGDVVWSVVDDGGGVVPGLPSGGGHGLTGMRERVEVLGGRLTAGPVAGGWRVETILPAVQPTLESA